jgi:hypothetical protein
MTVGEKIEQRLTGRPDSHVPGRLIGLPERPGRQPRGVNLAMHFGQGALVGVVRALMANAGMRGAVASAMFTVVRLSNDQILENATGVGAPPPSWPRPELAVDLLHKAVYAFTTGAVADALASRNGPVRGSSTPGCAPAASPTWGRFPATPLPGADLLHTNAAQRGQCRAAGCSCRQGSCPGHRSPAQ